MDWRLRSACRDKDPDLFDMPAGRPGWSVAAAKAVCRMCAVSAECLELAYRTDDQHSVMGGLTPQERTRLRRVA
jgi:WhiB family redox-sensing transcriptional regulator